MKKLLLVTVSVFILLVTLFQFPAISQSAYDTMLDGMYERTVPLIKNEELHLESSPIILDTREKNEFDVSHIPGARWVGYDDFDAERISDLPKDAPIIVYCSIGYRSERIGEKLQDIGFTDVKNLYGGIFQWTNDEMPLNDAEGNETNKVHAYSKSWGIWVRKGKKVYD